MVRKKNEKRRKKETVTQAVSFAVFTGIKGKQRFAQKYNFTMGG
jgi:hypothetical protein